MVRREVFLVESADAAVAFRQRRVDALGNEPAIAAYLEGLYLAIAQYSRGDALADVLASVRRAVALLENDPAEKKAAFDFANHDHYYGALWGLSLSMLFGSPSNAFLQRGAGQDAVYDQLLKLTGAMVAPTQKLVRPLPYTHLIAATANPKDSTAEILAYLQQWYAAMGQTHWHDTHIQQDPAFFGYWAFELAAFTKALDISDAGFADNIFYPRDLVHQRLFRTWLDGAEGDQERQLRGAAAAQAQLQSAKQALLSFFEGNPQSGGEKAVGDSMKMMANLLGLTPSALKENPEVLRQGLLQLIRAMLSISQDALRTAHPASDADKKKVADVFRDIQQKLGGEGSDLAEASKILAAHADLSSESSDPQARIAAAQTRLETINSAFSGLVADASIDLQGLFSGMDRLIQEHAAQLGITPPKPYDAYESTSKDVGKALDEANKKNMIGEDFDWSSLWKKS